MHVDARIKQRAKDTSFKLIMIQTYSNDGIQIWEVRRGMQRLYKYYWKVVERFQARKYK